MLKNSQNSKKAVILLSGGLDSSTALAIAKSEGYQCYALTIDYKQRNHAELESARTVAATFGVIEHRIVKLDIGNWGGSAMTDHSLAIPQQASTDIPITYVPARNSIFLTTALAWAEVLNAFDIFIGANIVDYSNYPDCRPEFLRAFETMANLATRAGVEGASFHVHAPLIELSKSDIIRKGMALGVNYAVTLSCYDPDQTGNACGICDSCRFRAKGFHEAGVADVTRYGREKIDTV
jgi:7-cyano-7-deazaguanine synthase